MYETTAMKLLTQLSSRGPAQRFYCAAGQQTRRTSSKRGAWPAAHYRAGQFDLAIQFATESDQLYKSWNAANRATNWPLLALAHHRLGHVAQSRRWLDKALQWEEQMSDKDVENIPMHVNEFLAFKVLIREAVELMAAKPHP